METFERGSTHLISPGPANIYQKVNFEFEKQITFPKAVRQTVLDQDVKQKNMPGPGKYHTKRYLDNK
jgi:hypothetical protein